VWWCGVVCVRCVSPEVCFPPVLPASDASDEEQTERTSPSHDGAFTAVLQAGDACRPYAVSRKGKIARSHGKV